ncbi:hypothetical protein HZF24_12565 [Sedimentibacter hydroxybenzoicus DSM 7310]|uniref:Uncharacterized protein n=1 Tax=Sedimentibacter hydroxybenzoicus DSM 7310 TaxID=1123245 RepID=A0A974BLN1_SEDHY|nr:hypothetical protein [Sedimentibacter hydroxybenzoicus]NYB74972.1 hypothetical protein [Sedimentibacter hydroxybenzoicus DSM 7310]
MGVNTKLMSIVFNLEDPLLTREYPSDIVLFRTFTTLQTNTPIWTPGAGKSIYLTALQVSAPAPLVVQLNRGSNDTFMSIALTTTLATYGLSFPSPIEFNPDEVISVTTGSAGTVNITLLGYEL